MTRRCEHPRLIRAKEQPFKDQTLYYCVQCGQIFISERSDSKELVRVETEESEKK